MLVLAVFAVAAVVLSLVGLYGVMAYSVSHRTRELGVRLVLGAESSGVVAMVVRQGAVLIGAGLAAGLTLFHGLGLLLRSVPYGINPWDPATTGVTLATLALVAVAATWIPARRAARTSPLEVLREEERHAPRPVVDPPEGGGQARARFRKPFAGMSRRVARMNVARPPSVRR
jgi:ABC-type antimicrobial peptide transport system permease subunit